jgi:cyclin-dependent kinase regulatory subunit CKS1
MNCIGSPGDFWEHPGSHESFLGVPTSPHRTSLEPASKSFFGCKCFARFSIRAHAMPSDMIEYSRKYSDATHEYRHVILSKAAAAEALRLSANLRRTLQEAEWRGLGVVQSLGWIHYEWHAPEPHILLFKRELLKGPIVKEEEEEEEKEEKKEDDDPEVRVEKACHEEQDDVEMGGDREGEAPHSPIVKLEEEEDPEEEEVKFAPRQRQAKPRQAKKKKKAKPSKAKPDKPRVSWNKGKAKKGSYDEHGKYRRKSRATSQASLP